ncbi:UNVERIFIED_CONTAM: Agglutinin [Sesamum latifolium]|uniref:Agglutinin n=1 Tax=Sesamum latifolium TaxID=2727402 RepID=A0AAW2WAS9_9LAMI
MFRQIIVAHHNGNNIVSSIRFVDGSMQYSPQFGDAASANNHCLTQIININYPAEYLSGVSVDLATGGSTSGIRALRFHTSVRQYDAKSPDQYWDDYTCSLDRRVESVDLQMEGGKVVGFHGHSTSSGLHSIGVFVKPICSVCVPAQINACEETQQQVVFMLHLLVLFSAALPGPWGGCGGKQWDDGVFSAVNRIHLHFTACTRAIHGIQFEYLGRDGRSIWSPRHGPKSERVTEGDRQMEVIKSMTLYTKKGSHGPYGVENGNYFTSMACKNGKVVGFRGSSSGSYLNAIGLHLEYV